MPKATLLLIRGTGLDDTNCVALESQPASGLDLVELPDGALTAAPLGARLADDARLVGQVWFPKQGEPVLVSSRRDVGINGRISAGPIQCLDVGSLLQVGKHGWIATTRWIPAAVAAGPQLADKPCPVCGLPLGQVPVVECSCGRWTHLERPDQPDDEDALNCYLVSGRCGACQRETTLDPRIVPVPHEKFCALEQLHEAVEA